MTTKGRSQRYFVVKPDDDGDIADMGPAGTAALVATYTIQFIPSADFAGQFAVLGRVAGNAAQTAGVVMATIPYRRINVNGVASDYNIVTDVISGPGIIQVPANGLAVGLLIACSAGTCTVISADLSGPSAI